MNIKSTIKNLQARVIRKVHFQRTLIGLIGFVSIFCAEKLR